MCILQRSPYFANLGDKSTCMFVPIWYHLFQQCWIGLKSDSGCSNGIWDAHALPMRCEIRILTDLIQAGQPPYAGRWPPFIQYKISGITARWALTICIRVGLIGISVVVLKFPAWATSCPRARSRARACLQIRWCLEKGLRVLELNILDTDDGGYGDFSSPSANNFLILGATEEHFDDVTFQFLTYMIAEVRTRTPFRTLHKPCTLKRTPLFTMTIALLKDIGLRQVAIALFRWSHLLYQLACNLRGGFLFIRILADISRRFPRRAEIIDAKKYGCTWTFGVRASKEYELRRGTSFPRGASLYEPWKSTSFPVRTPDYEPIHTTSLW